MNDAYESVESDPTKALASGSVRELTCGGVIRSMKLRERSESAVTKVKVLSPEISDVERGRVVGELRSQQMSDRLGEVAIRSGVGGHGRFTNRMSR